jgi:SAM-dependent methyltransferase
MLQSLAPRLERGVGIDIKISPECQGLPRLEFIESDLESALPRQAADQFDLILLYSVLEHLWSPLETLRQCHRLCRPGGLLFVNVPTWRGKIIHEFVAFRLALGSAAVEIDDHKMYYDKNDLWPSLVAAGFKPSRLRLHYYKFGMNLAAVCQK